MHLRYSNTVPVVIYSPSVKCLSLRNTLFSVCGYAAVLYFRYDHDVLVSLTKPPVFHCCVGSFARRTIEDAGETSQRHLNFTFRNTHGSPRPQSARWSSDAINRGPPCEEWGAKQGLTTKRRVKIEINRSAALTLSRRNGMLIVST